MRMRQDDIDALRIGIAAQERDRLLAERSKDSIERVMRRQHPDDVATIPAHKLMNGDVLCASDNGYSFYRWAKITQVGSTARGDLWIEYKIYDGGSGGHAMKRGQAVLVEKVID